MTGLIPYRLTRRVDRLMVKSAAEWAVTHDIPDPMPPERLADFSAGFSIAMINIATNKRWTPLMRDISGEFNRLLVLVRRDRRRQKRENNGETI